MKLRIHTTLLLLGLIGLAVIIALNTHQLNTFVHLLKGLRWYVIVAIIVVQVASYYINALYYQSILKVFGYSIQTGRLFQGALATNFVNYLVPSAGVAGAGFLSQVLYPDVPRGEGVLAQFLRYAFSSLAVLLMLPVGLTLIYFGSHTSPTIYRITIFSVAGILAAAILIITAIHHEQMMRRFIKLLERRLKRLFARFEKQAVEKFVNDFYAGYHAIIKRKRLMWTPFVWSMIYIVIEIFTFYLAFLAFGKTVGFGIAIMSYLLANIASLFGGAIFSTGVFELGMAGTLVALGQPLALAVSVTLVYRILNLLISLPPGFYFYKKYLPS
ncbi:MAG TPA: lysylphosphatidylglycerol synthase transmembrane domain-containing protein [Candidatus Saccharimonadales bacterium]|nr:lysylphosphatidylglycerol synthase transmembrane domain-containing protein [Candidatus Saccharimonadales bacterium]